MSTAFASGDLSIAVCDRCNRKFPYKDLRPDGNSPGLRVCAEDWDMKDPWRLPPIQPDALVLRFPRPDVPLIVTALKGTRELGLVESVDALELVDGTGAVELVDDYGPVNPYPGEAYPLGGTSR